MVLTAEVSSTGTARFDLSLELEDRPGGLLGQLEYSSDLFEEATIARMAGHWQTLLEAVAADPELRLSELPLLSASERHQLLVEWNATATAYPARPLRPPAVRGAGAAHARGGRAGLRGAGS